MPLIRTLTRPLARAAHLLFRCELRLRVRGGFGLQWVDQDAPTPEDLAAQRAGRERAELELIVRELAALMDEDRDIRPSLRHLAFIEQALRQQGLLALRQVPRDVLQRALEQFEGLVTNWGPRGLATLRSRMAVELAQRGDDDEELDLVPPVAPAPPRAAPRQARGAVTPTPS